MSAHWDKLAVSKPLNATAGRVASQSRGLMPQGPRQVEHHAHWQTPPATIPLRRGIQEDLTGTTRGYLRAVGFLGKGRWLVRCRCGDYEARTAKALKNPANGSDCCRNCRHHEYLKQRPADAGARPSSEQVEAA